MKKENFLQSLFLLPWCRRRPLQCPFAFEIVTEGLLKVHGLYLRVSVSSVRWYAKDFQRGPYWLEVFRTTDLERTLGFLFIERVCAHVCVCVCVCV